MNSCSFSS